MVARCVAAGNRQLGNLADPDDAHRAAAASPTVGGGCRRMSRPYDQVVWAAVILAIQACLIVGIAIRNAPNADEPAHLASGIYHWRTGRMDAYMVNPPLVRLWCTWPLRNATDVPTWRASLAVSAQRHEWQLARQLWDRWGCERLQVELVKARCRNLPFPLIGTLYCGLLASRLFGPLAGRIAMVLWAFSPNQLAWAASLCPDIHAAAIGIAAQFHTLRWSESNRTEHLLLAAALSGLAALAKSTWLLLLPLALVQFLVYWHCTRQVRMLTVAISIMLFAAVHLMTLNSGFAWQGTGQSPAQISPRSTAFRERIEWLSSVRGVRWSLADVPLPLPAAYLQGIDMQCEDFERGKRSYLCGTWRHGGWWYYYLLCLGIKLPAGYVLLIVGRWALVSRSVLHASRALPSSEPWDAQHLVAAPGEWLWLGIPGIVFMTVVSSQTGFSHHFRYAFPCLPYLFVFGSGIVGGTSVSAFRLRAAWILVVAGVFSSLLSWPACHGFFSIAAGGPKHGHAYLVESNLDWGEDLHQAVRWARSNPHRRPLYHAVITDDVAQRMNVDWQPTNDAVRAGWYVVSRQRVLDPSSPFAVFRDREPHTIITPSMVVFHQASSVGR
jgi:hypothetical protein